MVFRHPNPVRSRLAIVRAKQRLGKLTHEPWRSVPSLGALACEHGMEISVRSANAMSPSEAREWVASHRKRHLL